MYIQMRNTHKQGQGVPKGFIPPLLARNLPTAWTCKGKFINCKALNFNVDVVARNEKINLFRDGRRLKSSQGFSAEAEIKTLDLTMTCLYVIMSG
jgi:hypothetical protein